MGVWIRTKDKERLIDCKSLYVGIIPFNDGTELYGIYENGVRASLGGYSSEEKTFKVLDAIQEFIKSRVNEDMVFQMPQDEEGEF